MAGISALIRETQAASVSAEGSGRLMGDAKMGGKDDECDPPSLSGRTRRRVAAETSEESQENDKSEGEDVDSPEL